MAGEFLRKFFEERGGIDVKPNDEADVLCPFPHNKGFEKNSSAHINVIRGVFHCKTCRAEGRFNDGGLSEAGFIMHYFHVPYTQAVKMLSIFEGASLTGGESWEQAHENLFSQPHLIEYLASRGIDEDLIREYKLGFAGCGILYPVTVYGDLVDVREYFPDPEPGKPKIKSQKGASALLFPFDHWRETEGPTLLCAGENDTLLARKWGFNALTSTFGEGSFPKMFVGMFKGKDVYLCYDCDDAGKQGALQVAFILYEGGANVRIVDLGLTGAKDDKDVTDLWHKHGDDGARIWLDSRMDKAVPYSGEMYQEDKNKHYPLVDLWNVPHGEYSGRRLSSRVIMMGKYDQAMETPSAVEWKCDRPDPDSKVCEACKLKNKHGWWTLEDQNLSDLLKLVEVDEKKQGTALRQFIGVPAKCPGGFKKWVREKKHVQKVIFAPDVETEDELSGFRMAEHHAYTLGLDLDDGMRYRIFFRRYPHPKNTVIVSVVDHVEESDNAMNTFKLTPDMIERLRRFQGDPEEVMQKRLNLAKRVVGPFAPRPVVEAVNIMYHSVLDFWYAGKLEKGNPEGLVIGPSRTGKTDTAHKLQQFLGVGNMTALKGATTAGMLGGAEKTPSGGYRIKWGVIPRNHKGLLIGDELSGMSRDVMATLTDMRSKRVATLEKIVSGKAPAYSRLLWLSNPRVQSNGKSKNIELYPTGVDIVLDLIGSDEDIARFDFIVVLPNVENYVSPFTAEELAKMQIDNTPYRELVYWAWSRKPEQVQFAPDVDKYAWHVAQELNERYDVSDIKLFGPEAHKKIARIAVSVAAMCFSCTDDGESILIQKSHIDWARDFMVRCYDNDLFRLPEFVEQKRLTYTTNEEVNTVFASLAKSQAMIMKTLSRSSEVTLTQLQMVSGLDRDQFAGVMSNLAIHGLIEVNGNYITPTMRFRKAREAYLKGTVKEEIRPLSQQKAGLPF